MPKKTAKGASKKASHKIIKAPKNSFKPPKKSNNKKTHKSRPKSSKLLIYFGAGLIIFSVWFVVRSADLADNAYKESVRSASSLLAYDKSQIRLAKIVGPDRQLKNEIINFRKVSNDLQSYVLDDYRNLKKNCVVNGELVGQSYYKINTVAQDGFAIVSKGCNGEESNILAKFSGRWSIVFSGNNLIPCNIVNDYGIPQSISRNCQTNNTKFLNPNP